MAWKSLGKDAPRKGDAPLDWLERKTDKKSLHFVVEPEFLNHLKEVAKDRQVSLGAMFRSVMAVETNYKAPVED